MVAIATATPQQTNIRERVWLDVILPRSMALLAVVFSTLLIVSSYKYFNQTWDEPAHIGTGLEYWSQGKYELDPLDPPLPRISAALGLYLLGLRSQGDPNPWVEGDRVLETAKNRDYALALARAGLLPYFLLACFLVWWRARAWLGEWPAAAAIFFFAICPPLMGHAGLATTDVCFAAVFFLAMDRWAAVISVPTFLNYFFAGAATGLAIFAKLSAIPYLGLCLVFLYAIWYFRTKQLPHWRGLLLAASGIILVLAIGYRFAIGPIATSDPKSQTSVAALVARSGHFRSPVQFMVNHVPLYPFWQGFHFIVRFSHTKPEVFLLGKNYPHGVFYFYIVGLLAKTPLAFLIMALAGVVIAVLWYRRTHDFYIPVIFAGILGPFLFASASHVNLGVRHVLVIFPFAALLIALACKAAWEEHGKLKPFLRAGLLLLISWEIVTTVRTYPDYLAYFNEIAAPNAAWIDVTDLDWGQDLKRLIVETHRRQVNQLWISYSGWAKFDMEKLPPWNELPSSQPVKGWVAISEVNFQAHHQSYAWLDAYKPVTEVGRSIRLYWIP